MLLLPPFTAAAIAAAEAASSNPSFVTWTCLDWLRLASDGHTECLFLFSLSPSSCA